LFRKIYFEFFSQWIIQHTPRQILTCDHFSPC
jgi:hypothetical protein